MELFHQPVRNMANLDIKNLIENFGKELDPDIEKEPSLRRFMERFMESFLEEASHPENFSKINQYTITSITIENFKCIGDAVTIPIRPITLLFGKNSAGKSTILQALDYYNKIWQDKSSSIRAPSLGIEMSGGYTIDFRDFRSLVHRHELDRKIRIRVEYANIVTSESKNEIYQWREIVTGCKEEYPDNVESLLIGLSMNGEELVHFSWKLEEIYDNTVEGSDGEELIRKEKEGFPEDFLFEIYVNANTNQTQRDFIDLYLSMSKNSLLEPQEFANRFGSSSFDFDIRHLGPFREVLQTSDTSWKKGLAYLTSRILKPFGREIQTPNTSWEKGLAAWNVLSKDSKLVEKTNHYIQNVLNLGYSINYQKHNSTDFGQWPYLHDENNNIDVRLSDIGVGIAQVIPAIVGALDDSHSPRIFAVEQPELHVHPAVQVALGDVFIDSIKSIKSGGYSNNEAFDKFSSMLEDSKKELLDRIKNIDDSAIDIGMIKDKDPLDVEVFLDDMKKDKDPLDAQFKELFKIKQSYDHNIQTAFKELTQELVQGILRKIEDTNRTIIIETHSEHLLLRLLRRVRETTRGEQTDHILTPNDLSVIYARPTPAGAKFTSLPVTNDGDFDKLWPEGFFEERMEELF